MKQGLLGHQEIRLTYNRASPLLLSQESAGVRERTETLSW